MLNGYNAAIRCIFMYDGKIIAGTEDGKIKIWNLENGQKLQTLNGHDVDIISIFMHNGKIVSAAADHTIKIWDFNFPALTHDSKKTLEKNEDLPFLLENLDIISLEQYSENLKCRPGHLQEIGILSLADLQVLGILNDPVPGLQHLQITEEKNAENYVSAQIQNYNKKTAISSLLKTLSEAVQQRLDEGNQLFLYENNHPWAEFQQKLNHSRASIEEECQPQSLSKQEEYAKIVKKVNVLINVFHDLDKNHQIAKLRAYVTQWGILEKWKDLHHQGINSLTHLIQKRKEITPLELFNMGK
jgi:hypothetical protein